jgi:hypothetical protein
MRYVDMTNITIKNLEYSRELDQEAMADVVGGIIQYIAGAILGWGAGKLLDSLDDTDYDQAPFSAKGLKNWYENWYR